VGTGVPSNHMLKIIKKEPRTRNAKANHKNGIEGKMKTKNKEKGQSFTSG
jgi:hypothetical protein